MSAEWFDEAAKRMREWAKEPRPDLEELRAQQDAERRQELRDRTLRASAIPPKYAKASIDNLKVDGRNRPAVDLARTIVEAGRYRRGMGLFGPVGVGKTHIAAAVANGAIKAGLPAKMFTPSALFGRYFNASSYGGDEAVADLLREVAQTPVLVLDDFGSESVSRPTLAFLAEILNARWCAVEDDSSRPSCLIVTANSPYKHLTAKYTELAEKAQDEERGKAIMDRVYGLTGEWIPMVGKSQRVAFDGAA